MDRLAPALTVQETALALLWRAGAEVYTVEGGRVFQDDPDDPMRTALRQVVGVFSELERRMVVKRLRDGRAAKSAAGLKAVGSYAYGYGAAGTGRARDATPVGAEQAVVRVIVAARSEGRTYRGIAAALDAAGLSPRRAEYWSAMSVRAVCQREMTSP